ncbi:MAG: fumarylacetoacetate hydrolase family protein [Clostridia bacterium]|nr:fumarylacetoacetate hydrolase family protein [Clostridia bacterium]
MKYLRFSYQGSEKAGILEDGVIKEVEGSFFDVYEFTGKIYHTDEVKLLAPCSPSKVVAVGLNYVEHIKEFDGRDIPKNPVLFIKLPHTVIGSEDTIIIPQEATRVDYEAELAVVIKKTCKNIEPDQIDEYLLGATCLNDVTERDIQRSDGQWTRGKNFETFCPIGPYIVSGIDYNKLDIKLVLNGEVKQDSNTSDLLWNVQQLVSFISKTIPLYPGDIVTTGTPSGVSAMKAGDIVEVVIENIGTLRNTVSSDGLL